MGGERLVRRMTNAIRPVVVVSLLGKGEAQVTQRSPQRDETLSEEAFSGKPTV